MRITNILLILFIFLTGCGQFGKACNTTNKIADQTIYNADKHVWSYERFRNEYANYQQHIQLYHSKCKQVENLEAKGKDTGQAYDNAIMARDGAEQMARRVAADYNARAMVDYLEQWKNLDVTGDDLPKSLNPDIDLSTG